AEAWAQVRVEFTKALALRSEIRRAGGGEREGSGTSLCGAAVQPSAGPIRFRLFVLPLAGLHPCLTVDALGRRDSGESGVCRSPSALESPMEFLKRVLIIDNERSVVGVLLEFFARFQHGHTYDVVPAYSAAEALDILLQRAFDLILLDMVIPGIGARRKQGLVLLKRMRDLGVNTPVLMMSGAWDPQKEAEALIAGAVGYLRKPFDLRDLD